jgi:hypothetical protein
MIKITSNGTVRGTNVTTEDGTSIRGISRIEIQPMDALDHRNQVVRAVLTFELVNLDITVGQSEESEEEVVKAKRAPARS